MGQALQKVRGGCKLTLSSETKSQDQESQKKRVGGREKGL